MTPAPLVTRKAFLEAYGKFKSSNALGMSNEARLLNIWGIAGDETAVVVDFGVEGYGLMLKSAADYLASVDKNVVILK